MAELTKHGQVVVGLDAGVVVYDLGKKSLLKVCALAVRLVVLCVSAVGCARLSCVSVRTVVLCGRDSLPVLCRCKPVRT